ncbi:MAG: T9SS type A sorting domain-containing protein [Chitinophagaceae bacterium]|nr:T9SS type A sorting domain-containing protein [Chitinophagaceae bacterium]MCW5926484.1 T9SS type A sorting domain-containing protein [Chitinophagaceae bacterium]
MNQRSLISIEKHAKAIIFFLTVLIFHQNVISQVQTQKPVSIQLHNNLGGYLESLPVGYDSNPKKKYPLIIFFHGIGEVGNGSAASLDLVAKNGIPKLIQQGKFPTTFTSGGNEYSFIVISPQYSSATGHEAYVGEVIKHCLKTYRVDEERIYITGLSMGGGVSYGYSSSSKAAADQIAAALYVCPAAAVSAARSKTIASSGLPVWATHSKGDPTVKSQVSINLVDGINTNNPDPRARLTIFESNSHDAWSKTYDLNYRENGLNIYEWLLQYKRTSAVPSPPIADAGAAQTITLPVNYASLDGSKSIAPSGNISSYLWTKVSGPANGAITSPNAVKTNITGLSAGVYQFQLRVTDNKGITATTTVTITVKPAPLPPIANAGGAQIITLPANTATLNGTASTAPSGNITGYEWSKVSGPQVTIESPAAASTKVSGLQQGVYVFQLKITDNNGNTATASVTITVNPAPVPPLADAGNDITIELPENSATLDGSNSSSSSGNIQSWRWTKISGPEAGELADTDKPHATISLLAEGVYEFQLEVTDENGLNATDVVTVTVNPAPVAPVADAGNDIVINLPENTIVLDGSKSTAKGMIAAYQWTKTEGPDDYEIENPYQEKTNVSNLAKGIYKFELKITDNNGLSSTDIITIDVRSSLPPVAHAGTNITIQLPENSVVLDGSQSNIPSGDISTYKWVKLKGGEAVMENDEAAVTGVTGLTEGIYEFELTVTAEDGSAASDTTIVTVKAAPVPPTAVAGENIIIILPLNHVELDGSGSAGEITRFQWRKVSGPDGALIENNEVAITPVKNLKEGTYTYELLVTDANGLTSSATTVVTVKPAPLPPVANAGTAVTITLPANSVQLDGSKSTGGSGEITQFVWTKLSGPETFTLSGKDQAIAQVTDLEEGAYLFQLKITNSDNKQSSATVTVVVKSIPPPPVADAGNDQTIILPVNEVILSGKKSKASGGNITTYQWSKISGPAGGSISNASAVETAVTGLSSGTYQFQLKVTDNNNVTATATVKVIVKPKPAPPVANAGTSQSITLPDNMVTLDGSKSSAASGSIVSYTWTKTSGPSGEKITSPGKPVTTITGLTEGAYQFKLTVTDNNNLSATATVTITVNRPPIRPPVANAGSNLTIQLPVENVQLDGSGSYALDGTIKSYKWSKISGPDVSAIVNSNTAKPVIGFTQPGTYVFRLTITDSNGSTGHTDFTVTVLAESITPEPPVAQTGPDQVLVLPENETILDGSASHTNIGSIVSYNWIKISGADVTIESPATDISKVTGLKLGEYIFELTVADNRGMIAKDTVKIIVNNAGGRPENKLEAKVYPNITAATATLELYGLEKGRTIVDLYDQSGRKSKRIEFVKDDIYSATKVDISSLPKGIYFLEIIVDYKHRITKKIIKM